MKQFSRFLLIVFFEIGCFSCLYATSRESFSIVWEDVSRRDVAKKCLEECISDEEKLLNVTKHLIGHNHILDLSEIRGRLSSNFLFVLSDSVAIDYLKFLRGLYSLRNNGKNGHSAGALFVLSSGTTVSSKLKAITDMQCIFGYGVSCDFLSEKSKNIQKKLSDLKKDFDQLKNKENALKFASTFHRHLTGGNKWVLDRLDIRVSKEIALYKSAELDIGSLEALVESQNIDQFRQNPQPLIKAIYQMIETTKLPDVLNKIDSIDKDISELFFKESFLDRYTKKFFLDFIRGYVNSFVCFVESAEIGKSAKDLPANQVGIFFKQKFSGEDFKKFVLSTLKSEVKVDSPQRNTILALFLKSDVSENVGTSDPKIKVDNRVYRICSTYLATFFPAAH